MSYKRCEYCELLYGFADPHCELFLSDGKELKSYENSTSIITKSMSG